MTPSRSSISLVSALLLGPITAQASISFGGQDAPSGPGSTIVNETVTGPGSGGSAASTMVGMTNTLTAMTALSNVPGGPSLNYSWDDPTASEMLVFTYNGWALDNSGELYDAAGNVTNTGRTGARHSFRLEDWLSGTQGATLTFQALDPMGALIPVSNFNGNNFNPTAWTESSPTATSLQYKFDTSAFVAGTDYVVETEANPVGGAPTVEIGEVKWTIDFVDNLGAALDPTEPVEFRLTIDGGKYDPAAIPEPSRALLLGVGVAAVCLRRKRS